MTNHLNMSDNSLLSEPSKGELKTIIETWDSSTLVENLVEINQYVVTSAGYDPKHQADLPQLIHKLIKVFDKNRLLEIQKT